MFNFLFRKNPPPVYKIEIASANTGRVFINISVDQLLAFQKLCGPGLKLDVSSPITVRIVQDNVEGPT